MITNRLSVLRTFFEEQIQSFRQIRVSCCLLLVVGFLLLLISMSLNLKAGTSASQKALMESMWQSFKTGFIEGLEEVILTLLIAVLLLCLLGLLLIASRRLSRTSRKKLLTSLSVVLLLAVIVSTGIFLLRITSMSVVDFVLKYVWELSISVVLLFLIGGVWRLLIGGSLLNDMLRSLDQGKISKVVVIEAEQIHSLEKWVEHNDITGFVELREEALYGNGLRPRIRSELDRILQETQRSGNQTNRNGEFVESLRFLLAS